MVKPGDTIEVDDCRCYWRGRRATVVEVNRDMRYAVVEIPLRASDRAADSRLAKLRAKRFPLALIHCKVMVSA